MEKRIRGLIILFIIGFAVITANLTYLQVFNADKIVANPYNTRSISDELAIERGVIQTADRVIVAKSQLAQYGYKRTYPKKQITAPITGYYDIRFGRSALEQRFNAYLIGKGKLETLQDYLDEIAGRGKKGNDITLSLKYKVQETAYEALGGRKGAVVAINPKTGGILAIATYPSYDPNNISKKWAQLIKNPSSPLLNRALSGRYPPGSSFKTISAAAALDLDLTNPKKYYPAPNILPIYGGKVTNYESKSYGRVNLNNAFTRSINTVFAQVGLEVGASELVNYATKFGFNEQIPFDLDLQPSSTQQSSQLNRLHLAWTAVGQAATLATPFEMALVGATIANSGTMMKPYLVEKIRNYKGLPVYDAKHQPYRRVISKKTAKILKSMMTNVVSQGTGTAASLGGTAVAGKTGTAEVEGMRPHAWFVGFAPADNPKIAVAVLVENIGTGGAYAAPIARQVMEAALK